MPCVTTAPLPLSAKRNWLSRHPVMTVLGILAILAILFSLFAGGLLWLVLSVLYGSTPAKMAVARAQANPAVVATTGTPLREGWLVTGNINVNGDSGHAELDVPVSGPKGRAHIELIADKRLGNWTFKELEIFLNGSSQSISLLNPPINNQ